MNWLTNRLSASVIGAFAFLILIVSPAHALRAIVATIALGEVQVIGIQAKKNTNIIWEGNVVTQSNKLGVFLFSTTNLPIDCVGQLSDGVSTISVVVFGCTTQQVVGGGVLKTGQTQCDNGSSSLDACPGSPAGQDGELQRGVARSHTVNVNGLTITDNVTGLEWEKLCVVTVNPACPVINDADIAYTWAEAFQKIADLNNANFAGHNDWRLPNINELRSLVNFGTNDPAIDLAFNNDTDSSTQSLLYWSSTTNKNNQSTKWAVNFLAGNVTAFGKGGSNYVRAVRGGS